MHPLSRWYIDAAPRQGLLMGFANITSEAQALQLAGQIQQAFG